MKTRLKDNIMLIILCIIIVWGIAELKGYLRLIWQDTSELPTWTESVDIRHAIEDIKEDTEIIKSYYLGKQKGAL